MFFNIIKVYSRNDKIKVLFLKKEAHVFFILCKLLKIFIVIVDFFNLTFSEYFNEG